MHSNKKLDFLSDEFDPSIVLESDADKIKIPIPDAKIFNNLDEYALKSFPTKKTEDSNKNRNQTDLDLLRKQREIRERMKAKIELLDSKKSDRRQKDRSEIRTVLTLMYKTNDDQLNLVDYLNKRIRIFIRRRRKSKYSCEQYACIFGQLMFFDKHWNLILSDVNETIQFIDDDQLNNESNKQLDDKLNKESNYKLIKQSSNKQSNDKLNKGSSNKPIIEFGRKLNEDRSNKQSDDKLNKESSDKPTNEFDKKSNKNRPNNESNNQFEFITKQKLNELNKIESFSNKKLIKNNDELSLSSSNLISSIDNRRLLIKKDDKSLFKISIRERYFKRLFIRGDNIIYISKL